MESTITGIRIIEIWLIDRTGEYKRFLENPQRHEDPYALHIKDGYLYIFYGTDYSYPRYIYNMSEITRIYIGYKS